MEKTFRIIVEARDAATTTLKRVNEELNKQKRSIEDLSDTLKNYGKGLATIGTPFMVASGLATKFAIDFEDAFAGIRKTVDATEEEFRQLEKNIREIAKSAPVSTEELAKIGELAGQLGVRGVENLTKFIDAISKISVTTNLTTEGAALDFARMLNVMGYTTDKVENLASAIVALGNNFATTEAEIVEYTNRLSGIGSVVGMSLSDVLALGTALSSVGVNAEAGATSMQKALIIMKTAVEEGGEKLNVLAETAGVTAEEFKKMWEDEASKAFLAFVEGMGRNKDKMVAILDELGMKDQRMIRSFLSLANAGDLFSKTLEVSGNAWKKNIALNEEASKRYNTTASKVKILKNNLKELGLILSEVLLPKVNSVLDVLIKLFREFQKFEARHPKIAEAILAIGTSLGVLGVVMTTVGILLPPLKNGFLALLFVFKKLFTVLGVLKAGFMLLRGVSLAALSTLAPFLPLILGIVAAVGVGYLAWKNWNKIKPILEGLKNKASELWDNLSKKSIEAIEKAKSKLTEFVEDFKKKLELVVNIGGELFSILKDEFGKKLEGLKEEVRNKILEVVNILVETIAGPLSAIYNVFNSIFGAVFNVLKYIFTQIFTFIVYILWLILANAQIIFLKIYDNVVSIFGSIYNFIKPILEAMLELFNVVFLLIGDTVFFFLNFVKTLFVEVWNGILTFLSFISQSILSVINLMFNLMVETVKVALNLIASTTTVVWNSIKEFYNKILLAILSYLSKRFTEAVEVVKNRLEIIKNSVKSAWEFVEGITQSIWDSVKNTLKEKVEGMFKTVSDFVGKIIAKFNEMKNGIMSALRAIKFPHLRIETSEVEVGGRKIKYPHLKVDWYEKGGWVRRTGLAMVHAGEFVLSRDMLRGLAPIPQEVFEQNIENKVVVYANVSSDIDVYDLSYKLGYLLRNG